MQDYLNSNLAAEFCRACGGAGVITMETTMGPVLASCANCMGTGRAEKQSPRRVAGALQNDAAEAAYERGFAAGFEAGLRAGKEAK